MSCCQLPDDVVSEGYRKHKIKEWEVEQVFYSKTHNFKGTEAEFVVAGLGYYYQQLDASSRIIL